MRAVLEGKSYQNGRRTTSGKIPAENLVGIIDSETLMGELLREMKETGERQGQGGNKRSKSTEAILKRKRLMQRLSE